MKPIRLVLHAFGPYAGVQVVDFRQLGDRSLFLIHGPTGAGKTTILDGMCFALYGETSIQGREARHMRSDFAEPAMLTQVTFDFVLGTQVYRVTRSPQQERAKRRSSGMTAVPPRAVLWRRTGVPRDAEDGSVLASQWSKVTEAIEDLLGFRSDQFRQVVMLPQGEFRKLLLANSQERQQIFETLFQTEMYRHIEDALKDAAKEIVDKIKDMRHRFELILEQGSAAAVDELRIRRQDTEAQLSEIGDHVRIARQREERAQRDLNAALQVLEKIRERDMANAALHTLESRQAEFAAKRVTLDAARKAIVLIEAERELQRSMHESEENQRQLVGARAALAQTQVMRERAEQFLRREQERDSERTRTQQHLARLEELTEKVEALAEAKRGLNSALREVSRLAQAREGLQEELAAYQRTLEERITEINESRRLADQVDTRRLTAQTLERAVQQRRQLAAVHQQLSASREGLERTRSRLVAAGGGVSEARASLNGLETAWIEGQAAILAQELRPGIPCPVCGSTEHPAPARSHQDLPTEAALKEKRLEVERLEAARDSIGREESEQQKLAIQLEAAVQALHESLGDLAHEELSTIEGLAREARAALAQAEQAQALVPRLEAAIQQLKAGETAVHERLVGLDVHLQEATGAQARAEAVLQERESGLPEHLRTPEALAQAKQVTERRLRMLKDALDQAQQAVNSSREAAVAQETALISLMETADKTHRRAEALQVEFSERLQAAGFVDATVFQGAKRNAAEIDHLEEEIQRFDGALRAARDRVDRGRQAAAQLVLSDIDALESAARQAKADVETALRAETTLAEQLRQIDTWLADLGQTLEGLDRLDAKYALTGRIAEVAGGRNGQGITFQRFVLAALLDDVLVAASERLRTMSRRRFSLQRATMRADRRAAGGLDLEVYDTYTGTTRAVSTLSGGESFLASLSLALGLADVVQAYAGGIHLDTIFVDEGFGSLDPEALDLAFRALVDLQRGGRLVGIISHVPELKERIDVRLEVIPTQRGSVTRFITP